ncbi:MAG: bifunctional methionine sulfoxide reductase B/A protein [Shewanellaceae bacterium]|nr:bifunctional methionine sulfoxide reductase B/A protein [Shewanellaceae bacterium]
MQNHLDPYERYVIEQGGTEPPETSRFTDHTMAGHFVCRRCAAPLYDMAHRFKSGCGWLSFDNEVPHAIRRLLDADGHRTEIRCQACDAHLGHVFTGEQATANNIRHCVNSVALDFQTTSSQQLSSLVVGGGCFWCLEAIFLTQPGMFSVQSGYAGGLAEDAFYPDVVKGVTDHAEVVRIEFDVAQVSLEAVLTLFFKAHDPTTLNRQGNDIGRSYRSVLFWEDAAQEAAIQAAVATAQSRLQAPVVTEVAPLQVFFAAEFEHRRYYHRHPWQAYCQAVIVPKLRMLAEKD